MHRMGFVVETLLLELLAESEHNIVLLERDLSAHMDHAVTVLLPSHLEFNAIFLAIQLAPLQVILLIYVF